ncbi:MAG: hypothetical protein K940chlam5_01023, partial [Candidatus Anoxychlamydiales bacterium]|nr:hypothetical protein [Candidatus Anoxychlamydiales bacterium]
KIVVGVANSGEIIGVSQEIIQKAFESLEKAIYEASSPTIIPRIYTQRLGEKSLLIIEVSSGMTKPYFRKSEGLERGTYVRLGRSTLRATSDMIKELHWQSHGLDFETLPNYQAQKKDLDLKRIQVFLDNRKNHGKLKCDKSTLQAYHLIKEEHSKFYPTQMALLLFGKQPQYFLSEAMIICSHFQGTTGRDAIASIDCEGILFDQFNQCYSFIVSRLSKSFKIRKPIREEQLEIPEISIREALLNAIVHRNYHIKAPIKVAIYNDRIEIFSPGSFPGPLDLKNLKAGITYLRNPMICKIFREIGYIEKLGTGLIAIIESYEKRGLSDPKIIEGENYVKIILPRVLKKKNINREQKKLEELFALSSEISIEDVQRILGVSRQTASRKMNRFIEKGVVERIGKTRSTRYIIREHKEDV